MNDLSHTFEAVSLTRPKSAWFTVHQALGISPIDHLFNRLDGAYPHKFRSNFPSEASIRNWAESWVEAFEESGITYAMVKDGMKVCRQKFAWPPSCAEFIQACRPSIDPIEAYYQAVAGVQARDKGEMGEWPHPAIFWAAAGMAYELKSCSFSQVKNQWEKALQIQLAKPTHEPIPSLMLAIAHEKKVLSKEESKERIQQLGASGMFELTGDTKDWAREILANPKRFPSIAVAFAKEALGVA